MLAPEEHSRFIWLPWREAADKCFSWSNRDAILMLPERAGLLPKKALNKVFGQSDHEFVVE